MITDCFGGGWDVSDAEAVFLSGVDALIPIIIPLALCLFVWRIYVTNRRRVVLTLGLAESAQNSEFRSGRNFHWPSVLYVATAVLTFAIGLLAFKTYEFFEQVLSPFVE